MSNANSMALNGESSTARSSGPRVLLRLPDLNVLPKATAKAELTPEATLLDKSQAVKVPVEKTVAQKVVAAKTVVQKTVVQKTVAEKSAVEKSHADQATDKAAEKSIAASTKPHAGSSVWVRTESTFAVFAGWIKKGSTWLGDEPAWFKLIEAGHSLVLSPRMWMGSGAAVAALVGGMYMMGPGTPTADDASKQAPLVEWQPPLPFAPGESSPLPLRTAPEAVPAALSNVAESPTAPSLVGDRYPSDPLARQAGYDWQQSNAPLARNSMPRQPGVARLEGIIIDTVPTTAEARHEPNRPGLH